jgi:cell division transport system ATP-binding protein
MPAAVELKDVNVTYPGGVQALSDISLALDEGDFVFLVGPTGHGKSTLLKLLYREEVPTTGQVLVQGWDVPRLSHSRLPYLRRRIGVVFQDFRLLPQRNAAENIEFVLHATGAPCASVAKCVQEALAQVDLADRAHHFPGQLAAGEQQRLAIARAVAPRPALLLADEPTGNLDPQSSASVADLLLEVNRKGTTVMVATHDPAIVNSARRRVVALYQGRIVSDTPEGRYPDDLARD